MTICPLTRLTFDDAAPDSALLAIADATSPNVLDCVR